MSLSAGLRQVHDAQGAYLTPSHLTPHPLTPSHCHTLTVSRPVTPSHTHLVIPSPLHNATLSHPHSRFHICTLPPTHTLTPSPSHTLTPSRPHIITSSRPLYLHYHSTFLLLIPRSPLPPPRSILPWSQTVIGGFPSSASPAASPSSHTATAAGEGAESEVAMGVHYSCDCPCAFASRIKGVTMLLFRWGMNGMGL